MQRTLFRPVVGSVLLSVLTLASARLLAQSAPLGPAERSAGPTTKPAATVVPPVDLDWFDRTKNPVTWLAWGADERFRWEYYNNNLDKHELAHERSYYRQRTRIWSTITPTPDKNIEINSRLSWEFRSYAQPEEFNSSANRGFRDTDMDEALFDTLNIKLKNLFDQPLDVTVGRQDIKLGDGWLVSEGTPLDGSRSAYFEAARATYNLKPIKTTADLIYVEQRADSDWWIEPFNHRERPLDNQDTRGAILYLSNKSIKNTTVDGYFIYKHDELASGTDAAKSGANPILKPLKYGDNADLYTFGSRVEHAFDAHWKTRGELAGQFGRKDQQDVQALAFIGQTSYEFKDRHANQARLGYEYLSGDNPNTHNTNEGFDILWGRWARMGELYSAATSLEGGRNYQYTNLYRVGPGWSCKPTKKSDLSLDYHLLFSQHHPFASSANIGEGNFRGQIGVLAYKYTFNKHVSTQVVGEVFGPGDHYSDVRNDTAVFLRYELVLTW